MIKINFLKEYSKRKYSERIKLWILKWLKILRILTMIRLKSILLIIFYIKSYKLDNDDSYI